jgi:hypothetical protein
MDILSSLSTIIRRKTMKQSAIRFCILAGIIIGFAASPMLAAVSGNMSDISSTATVSSAGTTAGGAAGSGGGLPGPNEPDSSSTSTKPLSK